MDLLIATVEPRAPDLLNSDDELQRTSHMAEEDPRNDLNARRVRYIMLAVAGGIILLLLVSLLPG